MRRRKKRKMRRKSAVGKIMNEPAKDKMDERG